jgi:hypothetical protein
VTRTCEKSGLEKLRLLVVDSYDLVLTKLTRNIDRARDDLKTVAKSEQLSFAVLKKRYEEEIRPYLADARPIEMTSHLNYGRSISSPAWPSIA